MTIPAETAARLTEYRIDAECETDMSTAETLRDMVARPSVVTEETGIDQQTVVAWAQRELADETE